MLDMRDALVIVFLLLKHKTAYEMRIRDWSSDVCSSDLHALPFETVAGRLPAGFDPALWEAVRPNLTRLAEAEGWLAIRSEEHTSELQSLMRISYAVFCLKKNTVKYRT